MYMYCSLEKLNSSNLLKNITWTKTRNQKQLDDTGKNYILLKHQIGSAKFCEPELIYIPTDIIAPAASFVIGTAAGRICTQMFQIFNTHKSFKTLALNLGRHSTC